MKRIFRTWNRITCFIRQGSIRKQIIYSMIIVSGLIMMVLGVFIFSFSKKTIENNYQESHYYNLQVSSSNIEIQLNAIVDSIRTVLTNDKFLDIMQHDNSKTGYFTAMNKLAMEKIMNEITNHSQMIQSMTVVNLKGNWLFVTKNTTQKEKMSHYYEEDSLLAGEWVEMAELAKGKEVFFGYNVLFEDEKANVFSIVKQLKNAETGENIGYMVVNIRKKLLDKAFSTEIHSYMTNRYMIIDTNENRNKHGEQTLVYYNGNTDDSKKIQNYYEAGISDKNYLFSAYHNKISDWDIVNVIERDELSRESRYIGVAIAIAVLFLFLFSIYVATVISRRITKPLETLEQAIIEVGDGNYRVEAEFDYSEVGQVGRKFQDIVHNNLELRERLLNSEIKEREAELLLLQSQINPHFLYNTLDSLYFMAIIQNADDIAEMVKSLSDTFKLSLNKGNKLIRIRDELDKIKAYMKIQNLRHGERFTFCLEVEEGMMEYKILSFILQPIVENAVYHGLEPKIGKGRIEVKGFVKEKMLQFSIFDDGVGISDLSLLEEGYGVRNIQERLKLFYGEEFLVTFHSVIGQGTRVDIKLPIV